MTGVRIGLLGPTTLSGVVALPGRPRTLLARLALDAGRQVAVDALTEAVWPDRLPDHPVRALQSLVWRLRGALPDGLESGQGWYRLNVEASSVDAHLFERLALEGGRALREGRARTSERLLGEGLALWRGDALADVADSPFAGAAARRLREARLTATEDWIEAGLVAGAEPSRLVALLEEHTATHPVRERAHGLLMRALRADLRPSEALAAYERFRVRLADDLGADPGPELAAIHAALLRGSPGAAEVRARGSLRAPLTAIVGREEDRRRVGERLAGARLVTLTGPGGVGKSRLAAAVAGDLRTGFPGGVWWADLGAVAGDDDVPAAVATAAGLRESLPPSPVRDVIARLAEAFAGPPALIVLDGCEHVVDAAARLAGELLGRCPRLTVLATSRERLGLAGEALWPVRPLPVPGPGEDEAASPAVRLFAERAAEADPDFALLSGNLALVVGVCRELDGLPLALELAAARLRHVSLEQLAARLGDRFGVLVGGSRTGSPRHRTLRAVVDWSWNLLDEPQRHHAARLAVFAGTFSEPSAAWLGVSAETLTELADRSLIAAHAGRYRMLDTIRAYGRERLDERGELQEAQREHAACFLDLAERAAPHLRGPGQRRWTADLAADRDNLLLAFHHAREHGDAATALRLALALEAFWAGHDDHAQTATRLRAALLVPGPAPESARAAATAWCLFHAHLCEQPARAADLPPAPSPNGRVEDTIIHALTTGDLSALARGRPHPDPWTRGRLSVVEAMLHDRAGDAPAMRHHLAAAARAFREAGGGWEAAMALAYLAAEHTRAGDHHEAGAARTQALALAHDLNITDQVRQAWAEAG
ncbi:BTAD domain-containing putative transcriptional regulator [Nonomuraea sp. NPDC050547]|uniref:BTAD domain-containing putative transcriptional regulator n=1 Tax=Nonomuraea sp. NPDC050547 TaxID=3364368 RepID=UPI00378AF1ED